MYILVSILHNFRESICTLFEQGNCGWCVMYACISYCCTVHEMCIVCIVRAIFFRTSHTRHIHISHTQHIHNTYTTHTQHIHNTYTYTQHIHNTYNYNIHNTYTQHIHNTYTTHTQHIHNTYTTHTQHIHSTYNAHIHQTTHTQHTPNKIHRMQMYTIIWVFPRNRSQNPDIEQVSLKT